MGRKYRRTLLEVSTTMPWCSQLAFWRWDLCHCMYRLTHVYKWFRERDALGCCTDNALWWDVWNTLVFSVSLILLRLYIAFWHCSFPFKITFKVYLCSHSPKYKEWWWWCVYMCMLKKWCGWSSRRSLSLLWTFPKDGHDGHEVYILSQKWPWYEQRAEVGVNIIQAWGGEEGVDRSPQVKKLRAQLRTLAGSLRASRQHYEDA